MVDGTGAGVDGAKVLVDGQERSVTDENGYYKLDQVSLASEEMNLFPYYSMVKNFSSKQCIYCRWLQISSNHSINTSTKIMH